jgi:hypothetical protein
MNKYSLAFVVLAATLAVAPPSAFCDSFGYRTSGSKFGSNSSFDTVHGGVPTGIAESGIFTNTEFAGVGGPNINNVLGHNTAERPVDGAFFFDNLQQGNKVDSQDGARALIDLNGHQLVLLSGFHGEGSKPGKDGRFVFSDRGTYHVSNEFKRGNGMIRTNTTALTVTPEPASLFLLGTGLLGLALILFWKAAKHTTGT